MFYAKFYVHSFNYAQSVEEMPKFTGKTLAKTTLQTLITFDRFLALLTSILDDFFWTLIWVQREFLT